MFDDGKFHVIPAVRSLKFFAEALRTEEEWILTSNCAHIGNLQSLSHKCHDANKKIIVNHEIVGGLGADKTAFEFLKKMYHVDCVMGVHNIRLGMVKNEGMKTIQRITLSDSFALEQAAKAYRFQRQMPLSCGRHIMQQSFWIISKKSKTAVILPADLSTVKTRLI